MNDMMASRRDLTAQYSRCFPRSHTNVGYIDFTVGLENVLMIELGEVESDNESFRVCRTRITCLQIHVVRWGLEASNRTGCASRLGTK